MNNLNQYPADDNQKELYKKFPSTHYLSNPMNVIHSLAWCTFWRRNMHRFVRDYLKLSLYVYQELAIYLMGISSQRCVKILTQKKKKKTQIFFKEHLI